MTCAGPLTSILWPDLQCLQGIVRRTLIILIVVGTILITEMQQGTLVYMNQSLKFGSFVVFVQFTHVHWSCGMLAPVSDKRHSATWELPVKISSLGGWETCSDQEKPSANPGGHGWWVIMGPASKVAAWHVSTSKLFTKQARIHQPEWTNVSYVKTATQSVNAQRRWTWIRSRPQCFVGPNTPSRPFAELR